MSKLTTIFGGQGWRIPWFGKGRSPILSRNANDLVRALNALGKIRIERNPASTEDRVIYSDGGIVFEIAGQASTSSTGGTGMNYQGDYDAAESYVEGDVVRVRTGSYQGVYIAVQDVPAATAPEFPEPATPYWEILSLGVVATYEISDDPADPVKTVYVNASEGYI